MPAAEIDLEILQGKTFNYAFRWESDPLVYKAIAGISNAAPVQITTAAAHGLPDSWRVAVVGAQGLTDLNAENNPPKVNEFIESTVVSSTVIELNERHTLGARSHTAGTGAIVYRTPVDMTDYTARMTVKDRVGGTALLSLTTANGRVAIDATASRVSLTISDADTTDITWTRGVYELEMISGAGVVTALATGTVKVIREVTT